MMQVGDVFFPDDHDFRRFKNDCTTDEGWTVCYDKSSCKVATKKNSLSPFDVIRVKNFNFNFFKTIPQFSFRFNQNLVVYQVNYCTMLYMMVSIAQHGIPLCPKGMKFVL